MAFVVTRTCALPIVSNVQATHTRSVTANSSSVAPPRGAFHTGCGGCCFTPSQAVSVSRSSIKVAAAQAIGQETQLPEGFVRYETMIVLRPDLSDEDRDVELAKFEAFLAKDDCTEVNAMVRGRQRLAYPIKKFWEGIFVLYNYNAPRKTAQAVQKYLSTPVVGAEYNILRHMTFCR